MTMNIPPRGHYSAPPPSPPFRAHATSTSLRPRGGKTSKPASQKWLSAGLRPETSSLTTLLAIQVLFMIATLSVISYMFLGPESDPAPLPSSNIIQAGHSIDTLHVIAEPTVEPATRPVHTAKADPEVKSASAETPAKSTKLAAKSADAADSEVQAEEPVKSSPSKSKAPTASSAKPKLSIKLASEGAKKHEGKNQAAAAVADAKVTTSSRKLLQFAGVTSEDENPQQAVVVNSLTVSENDKLVPELGEHSRVSTIMGRLRGSGMTVIGDPDFIQMMMEKDAAATNGVNTIDAISIQRPALFVTASGVAGVSSETDTEVTFGNNGKVGAADVAGRPDLASVSGEVESDSMVVSITKTLKAMGFGKNVEGLTGVTREERARKRMMLLDSLRFHR